MKSKEFITSAELKKKWMKNLSFSRAYKASESEYQIARSVIAARQAKGLTQAALAKKAGTKQPVISRLENMQGKPSYGNMERIAIALGSRWELKLVPKSR